jgi:hypothetical protein
MGYYYAPHNVALQPVTTLYETVSCGGYYVVAHLVQRIGAAQ